MYRCNVCGREFSRSTSLQRHREEGGACVRNQALAVLETKLQAPQRTVGTDTTTVQRNSYESLHHNCGGASSTSVVQHLPGELITLENFEEVISRPLAITWPKIPKWVWYGGGALALLWLSSKVFVPKGDGKAGGNLAPLLLGVASLLGIVKNFRTEFTGLEKMFKGG